MYHQSVILFQSAHLELPFFTLQPESQVYTIETQFGYPDIRFASRPEFSKNYILRGPDEASIRALFTDRLLGYLAEKKNLHVEGYDKSLILYEPGQRVEPHDLPTFLEEGQKVFLQFASHASSHFPPDAS